jgi:prepilin-type N-terminal cleavage/methylation domain-containing protein
MGLHQTVTRSAIRRTTRGAFSLVEVMVVLTVIGVMIAISAPSFKTSIEQSRADIATANLRAIWSAERVYWLEGHVYADKDQLQTAKLLDPIVLDSLINSTSIGGYTYTLTPASDHSSFTAMATRSGGTGNYLTIDSNGTITATGVLHPGFQ